MDNHVNMDDEEAREIECAMLLEPVGTLLVTYLEVFEKRDMGNDWRKCDPGREDNGETYPAREIAEGLSWGGVKWAMM